LFVGNAFSADSKLDPRENLETAIPVAIKLLEKKDCKLFLEQFVPPKLLENILKKVTIDEFAKKFSEEKSERLIAVLKEVEAAKPKLEQDGKLATFQLEKELAGKKSISFKKINKYWYIAN